MMKTTIIICAICITALLMLLSDMAISANEKPAGVWLFDTDNKAVAKDLSGGGNDGKIQGGVKWTKDGRFGGALEFDGIDGWVEVPDHKSLQFPKGTDFTLACWIKITTPEPSPPMLIAKNYHPAQVLPWYALYYADASKNATGDISFFLRDTAGTSFHIAAGTKIDDNKWHHIVGTREKDKMMLYVDGENKAEKGGADFDVGTNAAPLHLMSHLGRFLGGVLDEVIIYRKTLSPDEIKKLMKDGYLRFAAVDPEGKSTTTWAAIKTAF
ncbi:LamG domain-containing protein [Candidatus Poribacteria bacterium]|nr:LamG domain-containing protein [Candidatus Poribacteria bacterium]